MITNNMKYINKLSQKGSSNMKKHLLPIILLTLCGISLVTGCSPDKNSVTNPAEITENQNPGVIYLMAGKVESSEQADISSKITAKVAEIYVDVGSAVKKGDPIIKLDSNDLEAQVAQARAGVSIAQANLAKIVSGARPEEISQAQAAFDSAKANYQNAKNTYTRYQQLFEVGAISRAQLEQYQTALTMTEAASRSAQEALNITNKGETPETINIAKSQVEQAQTALKFALTQLDNGIIVSPISGLVSAKNINAGEMAVVPVDTGAIPLVSVVNSDTLLVNAYLPTALIHQVTIGQDVVIRVAEIPDKEFNGQISVIDSVVDSKNKNILVKVKFKQQSPLLQPGMLAEIGIKN
jgi:HlyD family secretion protein